MRERENEGMQETLEDNRSKGTLEPVIQFESENVAKLAH